MSCIRDVVYSGAGRPFLDIQLKAEHIFGRREENISRSGAHIVNINFAGTHMGDHYQDIKYSTIVSRSAVNESFNQIQNSLGGEVASTLRKVADLVDASGNKAAEVIFQNFVNGLQQGKANGGTLKQYWESLVTLVPAIASIGTVISSVISSLGSS
jgi:hypothetical protein